MLNARGIGRLGMLAVGVGIGAAMASTPGIASADTPATEPLPWLAGLDVGDLSAAALPAASPLDLDISVDGFTVLDLGTGATATSGMGDVAIAFGSGADASATGGFGDYAFANSTGSDGALAVAGDPVTGATGNNFDFASASGNDSTASAGNYLDSSAPDTTGSSFDFATASGGQGGEGSVAVAGENGSGDVASAVGQNVQSFSGFSSNAADPANFDSASVWGNLTTPTTDVTAAIAGGGASNLGGSNDLASVYDPLGTVGSTATAGEGFNSALAAVVGDALHATAITANNLFEILGFS
jgi:hypothetical protein